MNTFTSKTMTKCTNRNIQSTYICFCVHDRVADISTGISAQESYVQGCGVGVEVSSRHCSRLPLRTLRSCCLCFRSSASLVSLDVPTTEPEPWSVGGASLSRDHLCGTVFLLLYGDQRWLCILSRDNWRPICFTSDVLADRRNSHHRPALLWRFRDSGAGYKTAELHTYLHTYLLVSCFCPYITCCGNYRSSCSHWWKWLVCLSVFVNSAVEHKRHFSIAHLIYSCRLSLTFRCVRQSVLVCQALR